VLYNAAFGFNHILNLITSTTLVIALIRNWLNVRIKVFHYDNERSAGNEVENMIEAEGILLLHVSEYKVESDPIEIKMR
jgi:hypothetical protein